MGYDMYWVHPPEGEEERVEAAYEAINETVAHSPERSAAWDAYFKAKQSYFRLNISGMSFCREIMDSHGMLAFDGQPSWPLNPGDEHFDDEGDPITDEGRAFRAVINEVLEQPSPDPGISVWKLGSNDGWIVTPEEIRSALAKSPPREIRVKGGPEDGAIVEWWPEWLDWLAEAADHGGFRVY